MSRFIGSIACALLAPCVFLAPRAALTEGSIYRCEIGGVVTFSDRPCGAEVTPYEPDATRVSTYEPPASNETTARTSTRKRAAARVSIAADQARRVEECARIQSSLRDIRARMRAGYSAKEGERLKTRERKLHERRRAQRCR